MQILGNSIYTAEQVREALIARGDKVATIFIDEMLPALWTEAVRYHVNPIVAVVQAGHETGWGKYGGAVPSWFGNTCGLRIQKLEEAPNLKFSHQIFPGGFPEGARAHIQHLCAYTVFWPSCVKDSIVDPRFDIVWNKKLYVQEVEGLDAWAGTGSAYGATLVTKINLLMGEIDG